MTFIGMDHVEAHTMKIIGRVTASEMKSNCAKFYESDVIYGRLRPYLNKVTIPGFEGLASAEFIIVPPGPALDSRFLAYRLNSRDFVSFANHLNEGDRPRVSFDQLCVFEALLPPVVEQRAIVAKIEALFSELQNGVDQLEAVRAQLKRYRQAVLKAAFEGKLTADWRAEQQKQRNLPTADDLLAQIKQERAERHEQQLAEWKQAVKDWEAAGGKDSDKKKPRKPAKLNDFASPTKDELAELPELPTSWAWCRPPQICSPGEYSLGIGPFGSNLKVSDYTTSGVPLIFVRHITRKLFDRFIHHVSNDKAASLAPHSVEPLDVLLTKMGDPPGDVAIYPEACPNAILTADCVKFRVWDQFVFRKYVAYTIESFLIKKQLGLITKGVAQKKISLTRFKSICFPLPPRDEQMQIVAELEARLSVLDQLEESLKTGLIQANALRQSILKKAFEGCLLDHAELEAVRADTAYESAEKLIERIRAEREAAKAKKPTRRRKTKAAAQPARQIKLPKGERYRQAAHAAYAVKRLSQRPTFGRVQLMKFLYLAPHLIEQESHIHAERKAAGPLDPAIHKVESLARNSDWFSAKKSGKRVVYSLGQKIDAGCEVAVRAFGDRKAKVDWLLGQFVKFDTERAELLATTFAVWNDYLIDGHEPSEEQIVEGVHSWHPEKAAKFDAARIGRCILWIRNNEMVPSGTGPKTQAVGGAS